MQKERRRERYREREGKIQGKSVVSVEGESGERERNCCGIKIDSLHMLTKQSKEEQKKKTKIFF